jgi:Ca-activated chloride channel homolog
VNPELRTDRFLVPSKAASTRHLLVSFVAPDAVGHRDRPPAAVAIVLDRSGSMGGRKLDLARTAAARALQMLHGDDRFALVAYDDRVEVVVSSTTASHEARRNALARLAGIDARGSTDLAGGCAAGCEQIARHVVGQTGTCLVLTDGLANVGLTDPAAIVAAVAHEAGRGVKTSTFGVGADFDERLLQQMAQAGGGHFYYVETAQQIPDLLTSELGETLEVVARDVALVLRLPPGVEAAPLGALRSAAAGQTMRVELGDLVAQQDVSVVLELTFPAGAAGTELPAVVSLVDRDGLLPDAEHSIAWRCADAQQASRQPRDRIVDRAVAEVYAARARADALELNRAGRHQEASRLLAAVARRIRSYAGADVQLNAVAEALRHDAQALADAISPAEMKRRYFASANVLGMRDPEGKARRRR